VKTECHLFPFCFSSKSQSFQPRTKCRPQVERSCWKLRNTSHIQYTMLRNSPGEIQETHTDTSFNLTSDHKHAQHICTSNFNNIFNPHLHVFPATSTLQTSLSWSQHLLSSSSHQRTSIFSSVCVCILDRCLVTSRNHSFYPSTRLPPHQRWSNNDSPGILIQNSPKRSHIDTSCENR
jgi:hypothetical protein